MTNSPSSASRLSGKCGKLDVSQPYGCPRPVTEISLTGANFNTNYACFVPTSRKKRSFINNISEYKDIWEKPYLLWEQNGAYLWREQND
jgi:hypothetical protein